MKKSLIVAAALIACTVMLTLITGLAQAQSLASPTTRVEEDEGEAEAPPGDEIQPLFVDPNQFFAGACIIGPQSGDVIFRCFNLGFPSASPRTVHCQLRNSAAEPTAFQDQFACQVVRTSPGAVTVRIRRIDDGTGSSGWGQDLRLNLFIVN